MAQRRAAYVVPARGELMLNGAAISERAGVAVTEESVLEIVAVGEVEVVIVDIPYPWDVRSGVNG
jgi:redox-sensitive bicupin YhaK (pirin superfamily)